MLTRKRDEMELELASRAHEVRRAMTYVHTTTTTIFRPARGFGALEISEESTIQRTETNSVLWPVDARCQWEVDIVPHRAFADKL